MADFKAQLGLRADLEDFVFEGVRYAVVGYRMSIDSRSREYAEGEATSEYWPKNPEIVNSLRQLKPGDMVYFENIRVKGPDNKVRSMQNINFKLN